MQGPIVSRPPSSHAPASTWPTRTAKGYSPAPTTIPATTAAARSRGARTARGFPAIVMQWWQAGTSVASLSEGGSPTRRTHFFAASSPGFRPSERRQLLSAGPLAVLAPWPAAGPTLAFLQLLHGPSDAAFPSPCLPGILDPADELVARQRRDVLPGIERRRVGDQLLA